MNDVMSPIGAKRPTEPTAQPGFDVVSSTPLVARSAASEAADDKTRFPHAPWRYGGLAACRARTADEDASDWRAPPGQCGCRILPNGTAAFGGKAEIICSH